MVVIPEVKTKTKYKSLWAAKTHVKMYTLTPRVFYSCQRWFLLHAIVTVLAISFSIVKIESEESERTHVTMKAGSRRR